MLKGQAIAPRLKGFVRRQQRRTLLRLLPFHLTANIISAPLTLSFIEKRHPLYGMVLLIIIETLVLSYTFCVCFFQETALSRKNFTIFNALLGICWASVPVVVFPAGSDQEQTLIAGDIVALIATSLSVSPFFCGTIALASTMIVGCTIALIWAWILQPDTFYIVLMMLLGIYAAFILGLGRAVSILLERYILTSLELEEQTEIVRLMLRRSDQSVGDWVWETDVNGSLTANIPALEAIFQDTGNLSGRPFLQTLEEYVTAQAQWHHLAECMQSRLFFRDLIVSLKSAHSIRVLSLTGHPLFNDDEFTGYRGIGADITKNYTLDQQASFRAAHDSLTGLPNRYCYEDSLRAALVKLSREHTPFALLALDLDRFKPINDTLGHAVGDLALIEISKRLQACLKNDDMLFRIGGDEMMLIHHHATLDSATDLAAQLVEEVARPLCIAETVVPCSISSGIALAPVAGSNENSLQEAADLALYEAKRQGGNTYRVFVPSYRAVADSRRDLIRDLREAIRTHSITLYYQPIINAQTRHLAGFEALARWTHPVLGPIPPDRFIRLAEEAGLMHDLGLSLLTEACRTARFWPHNLWISVNISVGQLYHRNFIQEIRRVLKETSYPSKRLQLEVIETIFMESDAATYGVLQELDTLGIRVVLDDFGKGYSSLGYLRFFPFSKIKLDASFVRDMLSDSRSAAIVSSVIALAGDLGVAVTAEGVETEEYFYRLSSKGCTEVQGYLFGYPMPKEKVPAFIEDNCRKVPFFSQSTQQS
ncbi:putative bifunctional diguanylate cyclase/phosphodiesterase [Acetobacter sp.]|jgi:diguanylate cyclase (GGDEF)-like protein|uniref:putative bifunctional diguanylate cyclase/phosphodiesterase n=1 Tax=Acetobacter sp. TaxID=440 RepID=UPI0025BB3D1E|nr:EAL domain-containing protein [Acetobacter sp.]MCH4089938.1 EAL domain-containing protein [Acetobacter sp.]MCI1298634.1 EAL domain-containing protein [Acetobacter sp.]MCI1315199.1 EAL domain-containing protein [Acetobacter sp.]